MQWAGLRGAGASWRLPMTDVRAGARPGLLVVACLALTSACSGAPSTPAASASSGQATAMPETTGLGDAEVSASVVPTRELSAVVARRYGVEQARNRVLVLVSLTEGEAPQTAVVTGQARDLRGVAQALSFREVQTDGFIDYVAVATATPPDTLRFELDVADTSGQRTTLRFSRDLAP